MRTKFAWPWFWGESAILAVALSPPALAASTGGGSTLPWNAPLQQIQQSLSGPVAFDASLIGIAVCGAQLIWGGEVSELFRRLINIVLVCSLLVASNNIMPKLITGALVPQGTPMAPFVALMPVEL